MRGYPPRRNPAPAGPTVYVPGRLYGVRRWQVLPDVSGAPRLTGLNRIPWRSGGQTTAARCKGGGVAHKGPAPEGTCRCGLYAIHPWAIAESSVFGLAVPSGGLEVAGVVEAWGVVQVHGEGFRAQYARPTALALVGDARGSEHGELIARLADEHRAEVIELGGIDGLADHCENAELGLSRRTVTALLSGGDPRRG